MSDFLIALYFFENIEKYRCKWYDEDVQVILIDVRGERFQ
ncbi:hypothetical protein GFC29_3555 [Anoxybacillus sp. B7M1]|jgi:hypothetical protein|nr:hypothetical protein GFC28_1879 [Anoxybacillus sp. B2M1]ANB63017.1 hypothetical protein GFC29_3555 [Anoxybacillus sp. B7M1]